MTRDSEQKLTYQAEDVVELLCKRDGGSVTLHGTTLTIPVERRFGTVENVQQYVDRVLALNWVRETYPERSAVPCRVVEKRTGKNAHWRANEIHLCFERQGIWMLRELVVLHELAHHLDRSTPAHSAEFRGVLVHLVEGIIGPEVALVLRTAFWDQGLAIAEPVSA